jgi:hypothetical protein
MWNRRFVPMRRVVAAVAVVLVLLASGCRVAPVAAPADPSATAVAAQAPAVAAPAPRVGLFGRVRPTPEQRAQRLANFAKSPLGQMVNALLKPLEGLTGGILKPVGQTDPAKQKLPADSAGGAAAKIAADAAEAKAKIADLEFLSKQDCRRYPEAEAAILNALRAERSECVRWAAAKALLSGCCCSPKVMKALTVVVNMSETDGNLAEESERVRATALLALEKCLNTCQPPKAEEPPEKPAPKEKEKAEGEVAAVKYEEMTEADIFAAARAAVAKGVPGSARATQPANLRDLVFGPQVEVPITPPPPSDTPPKDRSLTGLFREAAGK